MSAMGTEQARVWWASGHGGSPNLPHSPSKLDLQSGYNTVAVIHYVRATVSYIDLGTAGATLSRDIRGFYLLKNSKLYTMTKLITGQKFGIEKNVSIINFLKLKTVQYFASILIKLIHNRLRN